MTISPFKIWSDLTQDLLVGNETVRVALGDMVDDEQSWLRVVGNRELSGRRVMAPTVR